MKNIIKNPTFFVDIDGTIVKYRKFTELSTAKLEPIQDVIDYLNNHYQSGSIIIITTGRPDTYREFTIEELRKIGLNYHQLVMDLGRGTRVIFNDKDPDASHIERAVGFNFTRNNGLDSIGGPPNIYQYESD